MPVTLGNFALLIAAGGLSGPQALLTLSIFIVAISLGIKYGGRREEEYDCTVKNNSTGGITIFLKDESNGTKKIELASGATSEIIKVKKIEDNLVIYHEKYSLNSLLKLKLKWCRSGTIFINDNTYNYWRKIEGVGGDRSEKRSPGIAINAEHSLDQPLKTPDQLSINNKDKYLILSELTQCPASYTNRNVEHWPIAVTRIDDSWNLQLSSLNKKRNNAAVHYSYNDVKTEELIFFEFEPLLLPSSTKPISAGYPMAWKSYKPFMSRNSVVINNEHYFYPTSKLSSERGNQGFNELKLSENTRSDERALIFTFEKVEDFYYIRSYRESGGNVTISDYLTVDYNLVSDRNYLKWTNSIDNAEKFSIWKSPLPTTGIKPADVSGVWPILFLLRGRRNKQVIYYKNNEFDLYNGPFNYDQVWFLNKSFIENNKFLIMHIDSGKVICNDQNNNVRVEFLDIEGKEFQYLWTIEKGTGANNGYVRFINSSTKKALISRVNESERTIKCDLVGDYDDQWFFLDQSSAIIN